MTTATRRARASATEPASPKRALFIALGLLIAAAIVAVIVALAAGGDSADDGSSASARIPQGEIRQVSFAEITGAALPAHETLAADPAIGMQAPEFVASYFDNEEVTVSPGDGTPRIMLFLAHWCPHCQDEVAMLSDHFATNGVPEGVQLVPISTSVDAGAPNHPPSAWLLDEGWPIPVLRDSAQRDLAVGYGLSAFPFIVAVDGDGTVVSRSSGGLNVGQWDALINSLASG